MTTPEEVEPAKKGIATWKLVLGSLLFLAVIGVFSGGSNSSDSSNSTTSTSSSSERVDSGTHMACEHWRINLRNASVETRAQQVENAQKVNRYASVSSIPEIVSNARAMTEAFLIEDGEAYLKYATAFGSACEAVGE
jgi:hypothetical protein